jgi:hypothetical protein
MPNGDLSRLTIGVPLLTGTAGSTTPTLTAAKREPKRVSTTVSGPSLLRSMLAGMALIGGGAVTGGIPQKTEAAEFTPSYQTLMAALRGIAPWETTGMSIGYPMSIAPEPTGRTTTGGGVFTRPTGIVPQTPSGGATTMQISAPAIERAIPIPTAPAREVAVATPMEAIIRALAAGRVGLPGYVPLPEALPVGTRPMIPEEERRRRRLGF